MCALVALPLLTACETGRFDTKKSTALVLPPVIQYEREFLQRAADEVERNSSPALIELAKDYKLTRDKLRIAHEGLK